MAPLPTSAADVLDAIQGFPDPETGRDLVQQSQQQQQQPSYGQPQQQQKQAPQQSMPADLPSIDIDEDEIPF